MRDVTKNVQGIDNAIIEGRCEVASVLKCSITSINKCEAVAQTTNNARAKQSRFSISLRVSKFSKEAS